MDKKENILMNYKQAAEFLMVHPVTLRRWCSERRISCVRLAGTTVRFRIEDLENFMVIQEVAK
jgi:excisionase family DNA binding protein